MQTSRSFSVMTVMTLALLLSACGGGGDSGSPKTDPTGGRVTIAAPPDTGYYSTACDNVSLLGTLSICEHTWSASAPLVPGDNFFKVTTVDPSGIGDADTITVNTSGRSGTVSGTLASYERVALDL